MSTISHYGQDELTLFAMQLLPGNEHATMATHIAACTYCRQELAQLQGDLAAYSHTVDMHSPPMRIRERLLNQVGREKKHNPVDRLPTPEHIEIPALRSESVSRAERIERIDRSERIEKS
ncbi:MAG TPA: hypothetical protein VIM60_11880, partial [Edaphobacter sp.]